MGTDVRAAGLLLGLALRAPRVASPGGRHIGGRASRGTAYRRVCLAGGGIPAGVPRAEGGILAGVPRGSLLLAFLATAAVIVAIPGPSLLFTIGRALTVGRRAALLTVVGNALGLLVQSLLVAVGLGAVLAASAAAYTIVKLAGAAYLVYLGVQAIRHRGELAGALLAARSGGGEPVAAQGSDRSRSDRSSLLQGLTVGLTNPKTLVFLSSLLPQFVDPASAPQPQILALGAVFAAMALAGDSVWALAAGRARDWFARSPRRLARLGVGGGALMIGLGVSVAVAGRPDLVRG